MPFHFRIALEMVKHNSFHSTDGYGTNGVYVISSTVQEGIDVLLNDLNRIFKYLI